MISWNNLRGMADENLQFYKALKFDEGRLFIFFFSTKGTLKTPVSYSVTKNSEKKL